MSTNKKREGINRFACDVSLYDAEKPKASMKYHKPPLPIILFGIVACGFVGQPFSKQLYILRATDSSIPPGLMNKVVGIYISVPWFRLTPMDLAIRVLFQRFQTIFDRIKTELPMATGPKSTSAIK